MPYVAVMSDGRAAREKELLHKPVNVSDALESEDEKVWQRNV